MPPTPESMRALVLSAYGKPSTYRVGTVPTPKIKEPHEVLIRVYAAGVNRIDIDFANGMVKVASKATFPYIPGFDAAGKIVAVGSAVKDLKVGDAVFTRVPDRYRGTFAEYCISTSSATALKPTSVPFSDAAAIPLAGLTALQSIRRAQSEIAGGLTGKTVLVPGGLSGVGSFAVQLLRNEFGAGKVVTTLSPGKIAIAKDLWAEGEGEMVYLDYTKKDVDAAIREEGVDFMLDTTANAMASLRLIRSRGVIVTVSKLPAGGVMKSRLHDSPWILVVVLNLINWLNIWRASRYGVKYSYLWMKPDRKGLEELASWVDGGKVKPVVGRKSRLEDLEAVKDGCEEVFKGNGGLGKFVIEII
ncbi:chaperonin 10-like protein [Leptodontidium sp. MPI-SDFR-AT-0119]|nr:chaperonin 10-like protein [Leptodontidium sp. MPI-SDFR-AT-0119]